jgi:O-antigen ligase
MDLPDEVTQNSFNIRTGIYKCSFEIIKENWVVGVGPGNLQLELNQCYDKISKAVYEVLDYNTHNQYLDYWASMGFLAPALLLLLFAWVLYHNYLQKNWLAIAICSLFIITFFTENVLLRQNGVVIFSLFMSLFGFNSQQSQKKH